MYLPVSVVAAAAENTTLAMEFNTVEKLVAEPRMQRWLKYARGAKPMTKSEQHLVMSR